MLLLPNYSPKEREAIINLGKEAAFSQRLSREWKGFLTYHRVAWNILHRRLEVRNCPGWQVQLLVWIFCCWQWKDQINFIIKHWEKFLNRDNSSCGPKVEEGGKEDGNNEEDKDSSKCTKYSLGNIVQLHLEEEEAKKQDESEKQGGTNNQLEVEVKAEAEAKAEGKSNLEKRKTKGKDKEDMKEREEDKKWKKLKEILIKYDVSMDCIQLFQKFRVHCKIKNLSRPSTFNV